jgi:TatD DNase family protein
MFVDTHVHLQHNRYVQDLDEVLTRAAMQGVTVVIIPGTNLEDSRAAVALAERYAGPASETRCTVYAAVGIHPTDVDTLTPAVCDALRDLASNPRVVAIGEIGLDYYWPRNPDRTWPCAEPAQQRAAFEAQLGLAAELGLPVLVHDRDAHEDTLHTLRAWVTKSGGQGTLHAYAGGPDLLEQALTLGFYIGMDGPVTFKKATRLHEVARSVPLDRLLLETDGPYLAPVPYRGQRNEPAYLPHVAQRIADIKVIPVNTLADATTDNARRLLRLNCED